MHNAILNFWQNNLWRSDVNQLSIPWQPYFELIDKETITKAALQCHDSPLWIAPIVARRESDNRYWIPFFIPFVIQEGTLQVSSKALPFMGMIHFESLLGQSAFCGTAHELDTSLRFEWLDENHQPIYQSWLAANTFIENLLNSLSDNQWQQTMSQQGYNLIPQVILFPENKTLLENKPNLLTNTFATLFDFQAKNEFTLSDCFANTALLCAQSDAIPFSQKAFMAAIHVMLLEPGELLGVKAPVGSNGEKWIEAIVNASILNTFLKNNDNQLSFYRLKGKQLSTFVFSLDLQRKEALEAIWSTFQQGVEQGVALIDLIETINEQGEGETQDQIEQLQSEDEIYEKQLTRLLQLQKDYITKNQRSSLVSWLLRPKKIPKETLLDIAKEIHEPEAINFDTLAHILSERIRQTKVARTKIHQQLVDLVEENATYLGAKKRWSAWLDANVVLASKALTQEEQILAMQAFFAQKIFSLGVVKGSWERVDTLQACDLLIIENAQKLLASEVIPYLAHAQKAVFLGDNQDINAVPVLSSFPEEWELARYELTEEEIIEELQYKGMLLSNGTAFRVALANSAYQEIYDHGVQVAGLSIDTESPELEYHGMTAIGDSRYQGKELVNESQAQIIVQWLTTGPLAKAHEQTAILTPFGAQKEFLLQKLKDKSISCEVLTFDELTGKRWHHVIFSPVYTAQNQRPFVFDQGENMIYSLQRRATQSVWVIGDLSIFDERMHSPSGNLAKKLFAKVEQVVA